MEMFLEYNFLLWQQQGFSLGRSFLKIYDLYCSYAASSILSIVSNTDVPHVQNINC